MGPVTPAGKARSAQNALRHGGFASASRFVLSLISSERQRYDGIVADLARPDDDAFDRSIVRQIAQQTLALQRAQDMPPDAWGDTLPQVPDADLLADVQHNRQKADVAGLLRNQLEQDVERLGPPIDGLEALVADILAMPAKHVKAAEDELEQARLQVKDARQAGREIDPELEALVAEEVDPASLIDEDPEDGWEPISGARAKDVKQVAAILRGQQEIPDAAWRSGLCGMLADMGAQYQVNMVDAAQRFEKTLPGLELRSEAGIHLMMHHQKLIQLLLQTVQRLHRLLEERREQRDPSRELHPAPPAIVHGEHDHG
ncbi:hypothetical protein ACERK3_16285 [Phycisphaerales bacterium AB-hyl4]|uniref:Uncharacterized protein n=1 Tax=Natronomicrosphaera hydrolytica TaxID=3242702 RepID=A0ABV4UBP7_9BACT